MVSDSYPNGMSTSDLQHVGEITDANQSRLEFLHNERDKSFEEIDQINDYINELNDEIRELEFGYE